jgi:hypothetical protein
MPLPWPWPRLHPARTEVAAVHCVLTVKKGGSLRSATTPTKRDRLLISLPVEQQLLELKPNGSKIGNTRVPTSSGRRESSTWLVHPPEVPLQVRCVSEGPSRGGKRAVVWRAPFPTVGPPVPMLSSKNTVHAKPKASRSRTHTSFSICVDLVPVEIDG